MSKKRSHKGHQDLQIHRDSKLMERLRKDCVKGYKDKIEQEREEKEYERLKEIPVVHPPFYGEPVRIIQGKEFGPKL